MGWLSYKQGFVFPLLPQNNREIFGKIKLEMVIYKLYCLSRAKFWGSFVTVFLVLFLNGCSPHELLVRNEKIELKKMDLVIKPVFLIYTYYRCFFPEFPTHVKSFDLLDKNKKITPAKMVEGEAPIICNLIYPELAKRAGIEGTVELEIEVNRKGYPQNIIIKKAIGGGCDESAVRAVQHSLYYPAKLSNNRINTRYKLCIQFLFPEEIKNEVKYRPMEFSNGYLKLRIHL